ncbi:MAG: DUF1097 domain-containing protein [Kiritimatiellae bacterium]|nr:DUF1097 domain-containing protein [Kiritimatiellia bacterium]
MSFGKFIIIPILLGVQAAILMLIGKFIPGSTAAVGGPGLLIFVTFQAWAVYFAAGCTPKNGVKVLLAYASGIAASIAIMLMGDAMAPMLGSAEAPNYYLSYALAVFIIVIPAISLERVPMFDFIPGLFIGSGMFFAIMTLGGTVGVNEAGEAVKIGIAHDMPSFMSVAVPELIACAVGQVFGFITVLWRGAYEKAVTPAAS